jgi:hypothetical protein
MGASIGNAVEQKKEREMASRRECIETSAYYIWLSRGRPAGSDFDIWLEAERLYELTQTAFRMAGGALSPAKPAGALSAPFAKPASAKSTFRKIAAKSPVRSKPVAAKKPAAGKAAPPKAVLKKPAVKKALIKAAVKSRPVAKAKTKVKADLKAKAAKKPAVVKKSRPRTEVAKIIPITPASVGKLSVPKTKIRVVMGVKR